jgi:hypothetical protein
VDPNNDTLWTAVSLENTVITDAGTITLKTGSATITGEQQQQQQKINLSAFVALDGFDKT